MDREAGSSSSSGGCHTASCPSSVVSQRTLTKSLHTVASSRFSSSGGGFASGLFLGAFFGEVATLSLFGFAMIHYDVQAKVNSSDKVRISFGAFSHNNF